MAIGERIKKARKKLLNKLVSDEIKTETIKNDDNIIFKCTMPYWWEDFGK